MRVKTVPRQTSWKSCLSTCPFDEAARWSQEKEWRTASRVYDRIIEDDTVSANVRAKATRLKTAVDEESENLKRLERIKEIEVGEDKKAVLSAILPTADSVYFEQADRTVKQVRRKTIEELKAQFDANLAEKDWTAVDGNLADSSGSD